MNQLKEALEFYDKVISSTVEERIAVGSDHIDWLIAAARKANEDYTTEITDLRNSLRTVYDSLLRSSYAYDKGCKDLIDVIITLSDRIQDPIYIGVDPAVDENTVNKILEEIEKDESPANVPLIKSVSESTKKRILNIIKSIKDKM